MADKSFNVYCESRINWWESQEEGAFIRVQNGNLHYHIPTFNATSYSGFRNLNRRISYVYSSGGKYYIRVSDGRTYSVFPASYANLAGKPYDGVDINTFAMSDQLVLMDEVAKLKPTFWLRLLSQADIYAGSSYYSTLCWFQAGWRLAGSIGCGKHYKNLIVRLTGSTNISVSNATDSIWGWLFGWRSTVSRTYSINQYIYGWASPIYAYEMYRRYGAQMEAYYLKLAALRRRFGRFASILGMAGSILRIFGCLNRGVGSVFTGMIRWNSTWPIYTSSYANYYQPGMMLYMYDYFTGELLCSTYFYSSVWKYHPYSFRGRFWWW